MGSIVVARCVVRDSDTWVSGVGRVSVAVGAGWSMLPPMGAVDSRGAAVEAAGAELPNTLEEVANESGNTRPVETAESLNATRLFARAESGAFMSTSFNVDSRAASSCNTSCALAASARVLKPTSFRKACSCSSSTE